MTMPDLRTVMVLLLLGAIAAVTSFVVYVNNEDDDVAERPELQLAYYLDSATLTGTGPDGQVRYSMTTRRAQQRNDAQEIALDDIRMDYGAPQGLPWKVRADRGRIPQGESVIVLEGNIIAISGADHPNRTEIRTQILSIDQNTMLARTNEKVTLLFEERRLNATGMEADFATNNLKLLSNVNGKFIP
ncbi:MAG: LPS export ABC transporter periplasmic protein LptC [Gammaproteobacteria bacterium]|nr:LPS export ABC transporter periplasmic protein LptC [Gammaproteobacteria bacterium]NND54856.1 LPS export ABC transporter periplasmic protein LptC [Gammaproteobacteria bacterium]